MHRLRLSETGLVVDPRRQSIQDWVKQRAAEGRNEIRIDLAQVQSANSDVLVALSLAARQAADLKLPVVLVNANEAVRLAITQLGLAELGIALGEDDAPQRPAPAVPTGPQRPVVLVVDDDPINRRVAVLMLARMGCDSCQAAHGVQAIEVCRTRSVDVVLMDVSMPIMDGRMATRHIRAAERLNGRHVPIIGLSAHILEEDHREGMAAGMDDYLGKPVDPAELARVLGRWLPGRIRWLASAGEDVVG